MINKVIGTIGTRVYVGIVLLVVLGLHSKNLGAEILGKLAIFRLALTINHLFASVFSGPAVVYLGNRISISRLVIPTIFWVLITTSLLSVIQTSSGFIPKHYFLYLFVLSILYSIQSFLEQILLCKQNVKFYNISTFIHHTVLLLTSIILIFNFNNKTESVFFYSMGLGLFISSIYLFIVTKKYFHVNQFVFKKRVALALFRYGIWGQVNNFIQTLNYRFCLVLLDAYWGKKVVGYFSAALQLAEAVWIIAKSLATVQYSKIAAVKSNDYAVDLTLIFSKGSFMLSVLACVCLMLIPESTLGYFLGKDFSTIKPVMLYLFPGISFFSLSLIYCHYFSGTGRFHYNTIGSLISFCIIVVGGLLFIPAHGAKAAALINSAGLLGMLLFNLWVLLALEKIKLKRLFPQKQDIQKTRNFIHEYLKKS